MVFIDLDGSIADPEMAAAITNLREFALTLRILGSFTRGADRTVHHQARYTASSISDILCGGAM